MSLSSFSKCTTGNADSFNLSEKTLELATLSKFLYVSLILWAQSLQTRAWPTVKYCLPWLCPFLQAQMTGIWLKQIILCWKYFCGWALREPRWLCHKLLKFCQINLTQTVHEVQSTILDHFYYFLYRHWVAQKSFPRICCHDEIQFTMIGNKKSWYYVLTSGPQTVSVFL